VIALLLAYLLLPVSVALWVVWRAARVRVFAERAVLSLRAAGFTAVTWRVSRIDLAAGQLVTTVDLTHAQRRLTTDECESLLWELPCCVVGQHSFSWRQGIAPCPYCGAPVPASDKAAH